MEKIISPVSKHLIKEELTNERFVGFTNFENNEIYIFTAHECPHTMQEIGRLREIAYRDSGGGSGKSVDIDKFDTDTVPYKQIIVWNPKEKEIIGGYRFFKLKNAKKDKSGKYRLFTTDMFAMTDKFIKEYLPYTMELGKSFIQPDYQQSTNERKGMFSLDNLWDGLGALMVDNPDVKHLYGRVNIYLQMDELARDIIFYFLDIYFGDKEKLIYPYEERKIKTNISELKKHFTLNGFEKDFSNLNQAVRERNENIPPLIKAYMSLSPSMKVFGAAIDNTFGGNTEGIGIMLKVEDIYPSKIKRHIDSYKKQM